MLPRPSACYINPQREIMLTDEMRKQILDSISYGGEASNKVNLIIGSSANLEQIAGFGSGSIKIYPTIIRKFKLVLSQPSALINHNPFEIRCTLCHKVISYPSWYYSVKYAVNHFHFFVCFDSDSPNKPSTKCYRRG